MSEDATRNNRQHRPVRSLARRRPITMFLVIALGLSLSVSTGLLASGHDISPGILLMVVFLLGAATLVTALGEGRAGGGGSSPERSAGGWAPRTPRADPP